MIHDLSYAERNAILSERNDILKQNETILKPVLDAILAY